MDYRVFIVGKDGHFNSSETIVADDDAQALRIAEKLIDGHDVELATGSHDPRSPPEGFVEAEMNETRPAS